MEGSRVTAQRNGKRQTSGKESRGNRAQLHDHENVPRKQSPGLGPTFGLATDAGTECFLPRTAPQLILQSQKWDKGMMGQGQVKAARCMLDSVGIVLKACQGARDRQIA